MGNENYVRSVFLAEAHEGTSVGEKFDVLKGKFNSLKLTEPAGGRDKDIISEKTGDFFDTFSKGYKSVEQMEEIAGDNNKTETQKQFAMDDLDLLGKVVYDAVRDDDKFKRLVGQGSASEIDENLPKEFKGIGKLVLTNVFEEGPVLEALKELDENRMGLRRMPEGEIKEKRTREMVNKTIRKLANMENLTPGQNHDKEMSLGYLGIELEDGKTEKIKSEKKGEIEVVSRTDQRTKRGIYDHKTYGEVGGMEGVVSQPIPEEQLIILEQVHDEESAKKWISSTLVKMSENPLFFVTWWQQGPADQVVSMINEQLKYSMHDDEYAGMRDYVYATVSVLGLQTVDRNADANSDSYGQFTPPKNMAGFLHWDNEHKYFDTLRKDSDIKTFYEKIFETAFDENFEGAKQIIEAFSDGVGYDSQNKYLKSLIENELFPEKKSKDADLINKGRVAMAIFEVDFMPEWIRWLNASKRYFAENDDRINYQKLDWLNSFLYIDQIQNPTRGKYDTFAYSVKLEVLKIDEKGQVVKDEYGKDKTETKLGYEHPRVLRPWDVAAGAKGSYRDRPGIIWGMEKVLAPFIARRLSTKDGKHWITAHGNNAIDLYSKYGKFMSKVFGGSQGTEFDNLTSLDEILPLAANFWGRPGEEVPGGPSKDREEFGNFLSDLFSLKTDAMFYPGYKSNAKRTLNAIEGLDLFSGEMEKKKALEGALGPNANLAHGWVAEVRRLYNIDLLALDNKGYPKYQRFYDAYLRVFIDTPDINEARKYYTKAVRVTKRKGYGEMASSISNLINIWSK